MSMPIVGYTDRLTVEHGQTLDPKISCAESNFSASLVRQTHDDANLAGPGCKSQHVPSTIEGAHLGRYQPLREGSYVRPPTAR